GGVFISEVPDPQDKGSLPELDGVRQCLIQGKKDRHLKEHGEAATEGIQLTPLIKLHDLSIEGLLIILIFLLKSLDLRLYLLHLLHLLLALEGQGGEDDLEDDGQDDNVEAIVTRKRVGKIKDLQNRDGEDVQPAIPRRLRGRGGDLREQAGNLRS